MRKIWTRIWIGCATVGIIVVTLVLIAALHVAKFGQKLFAFFKGNAKNGPHS